MSVAAKKNNSKSSGGELMYPYDIRKLEVTTDEGEVIKVTKWLKQISRQLPTHLRYNKGSKKGQLVNHYEELKKIFKRNGKRGVKLYTKGCYKLITDANKLAILKARLDAVVNNTQKPNISAGKKGVKRENPKVPPQKAKGKPEVQPERERTQPVPKRDNSLKARRERSRKGNI